MSVWNSKLKMFHPPGQNCSGGLTDITRDSNRIVQNRPEGVNLNLRSVAF